MNYILGVLSGVALTLAVRCLLLEWLPKSGVEKPETTPPPFGPKQWTQTHNFLYYDGTVMPEIKEDNHEQ